jgi:hypothetical protein
MRETESLTGDAGTEMSDIDFEPNGDLSDWSLRALEGLDRYALGTALARLVQRLATFDPVKRTMARAAVERAFATGSTGPVVHDLPRLVGVFHETLDDPSRADVTDLVVHWLTTVDRDAVMSAIPTELAGDELPGRLYRALDEATEGWTSAEPPPPMMAPPEPEFEPGSRPEPEPAMAAPDAPPMDADDGWSGAVPPPPPPTEVAIPKNGGGPVAPKETYKAYGVLACDEAVVVGQSFPLEVGLDEHPSLGVSGPAIDVPAPAPDETETLDVQLFADGFDLQDGESWRQRLEIREDDRFPKVVLHLTPRDIAEDEVDREISVTFAMAGEVLGYAQRNVTVSKVAPEQVRGVVVARGATGANIPTPTGESKAHLTITIKKGAEKGRLGWSIVSEIPGVELSTDKGASSSVGDKDPAIFAKDLLLKVKDRDGRAGLDVRLRGIGQQIADHMPTEVLDSIRTAAAAVKKERLQLLILTDEPFVPWELTLLDPPIDASLPPHLGAQVNVGRWVIRNGTRTYPPRALDASAMAVVWGKYETQARLKQAEEEGKTLTSRYKAKHVNARWGPVTELLEGTPPAQIMHFAVHGTYNPDETDQEGIHLVNDDLILPDDIAVAKLRTSAPFVFLNACQLGSSSTNLDSYYGTAPSFLRAGASAVAPLWSVDDGTARRISLRFYRQVLGAKPDDRPLIGELIRQVRAEIGKKPRSATYLAYQFYGHPSLRLSWTPTAPGGTING